MHNMMEQTLNVQMQEAIALLFKQDTSLPRSTVSSSSVVDEYGNYFFPSDVRMDEPNIAYGSADGFSSLTYSFL